MIFHRSVHWHSSNNMVSMFTSVERTPKNVPFDVIPVA